MERNSIIAAFSVPGLIILHVLFQRLFGPPLVNWDGVILGIELGFGLIAALIVGITLFALRSRKLLWWHWLLISVASVPVAVGILVLITRIESWYGSLHPPVYDIPSGPDAKIIIP